MEDKVYLSKQKLKEIKNELEELKTVKRKEIAEQLEFAKSLGDLSENAEYHEVRDNQATIEERIMKIEDMIKRAEIVSDQHGSTVNIGSTVTLQEKGEKETQEWSIVGSEEADLLANKISNESPLGDALIGKKEGDEILFSSPNGKVNYTVVKLS